MKKFLILLSLITGTLAYANEGVFIKIMPLGDSITQANSTSPSYRFNLYKRLIQAGYKIDFVGSTSTNHKGENPKAAEFDNDHEGHWGWRIDEILVRMHAWAAAAAPDVALIHLGTNDIFQNEEINGTFNELAQVINILRKHNPEITLLVAKLIPSNRKTETLQLFNTQLPDFLDSMQKTGSIIKIVDQTKGFDVAKHTRDGVHPNTDGEELMAESWFKVLKEVLPKPNN